MGYLSVRLAEYPYPRQMAKKVVFELVDDIDGTPVTIDDGDTVYFALHGQLYEIDLTNTHVNELEAALAPYIAAARPITAGTPQPTPVRRDGNDHNPVDLNDVRAWAAENGIGMPSNGDIPIRVINAYDAATQWTTH